MSMQNRQTEKSDKELLDDWAYEYALMLYSQYKYNRENGINAFTDMK